MTSSVAVNESVVVGNDRPLTIFGGLNVMEDMDSTLRAAEIFSVATNKLNMPFVFKASFDKANRTSLSSYRGVGLEEGMRILSAVKDHLGVPVITDVHEISQAAIVSEVADVLQVPAFLARQTDLVIAIAKTGRVVNVKKPQFLSPTQMTHIVQKINDVDNDKVIICERGVQFGYDNLVVDMLGFREIIESTSGAPLIFDVTHSLQRREAGSGASGGRRQQVAELARAGVAVGLAGLFVEAHPDPDRARCDGPSALPLAALAPFLEQIKNLDDMVKSFPPLDVA